MFIYSDNIQDIISTEMYVCMYRMYVCIDELRYYFFCTEMTIKQYLQFKGFGGIPDEFEGWFAFEIGF